MEYKWICQDEDGDICKYKEEPCHSKSGGNWWHKKCEKYMTKYYEIKKPNRNWKSSLINLETHDYKIEDGILMKVEKVNSKRHKHADLIHAWAEGAEIQYQSKDGAWRECAGGPSWTGSDTYRIKPKTKTIRFRNYFTRNEHKEIGVAYCEPTGDEKLEWIGDWQEVEIDD